MKLSTHFTLAEKIASQTATRRNIDNAPDEIEVTALAAICIKIHEPVRRHYGVPVILSSGSMGNLWCGLRSATALRLEFGMDGIKHFADGRKHEDDRAAHHQHRNFETCHFLVSLF